MKNVEPSSANSRVSRKSFLAGTAVALGHEMLFAREVADRIVFMDEGLVVEEGSPQAMFTSPRTERLRTYLRRFAYNEAVVISSSSAPASG